MSNVCISIIGAFISGHIIEFFNCYYTSLKSDLLTLKSQYKRPHMSFHAKRLIMVLWMHCSPACLHYKIHVIKNNDSDVHKKLETWNHFNPNFNISKCQKLWQWCPHGCASQKKFNVNLKQWIVNNLVLVMVWICIDPLSLLLSISISVIC